MKSKHETPLDGRTYLQHSCDSLEHTSHTSTYLLTVAVQPLLEIRPKKEPRNFRCWPILNYLDTFGKIDNQLICSPEPYCTRTWYPNGKPRPLEQERSSEWGSPTSTEDISKAEFGAKQNIMTHSWKVWNIKKRFEFIGTTTRSRSRFGTIGVSPQLRSERIHDNGTWRDTRSHPTLIQEQSLWLVFPNVKSKSEQIYRFYKECPCSASVFESSNEIIKSTYRLLIVSAFGMDFEKGCARRGNHISIPVW